MRRLGRGEFVRIAVLLVLACVALAACNRLRVGPFRERARSGASAQAVIEPRPRLEITQPARAAFLAAGPALVMGRAEPAVVSGPAIVQVTVNGQPATVRSDGRFEATVSLEPGINAIVAIATDAEGRSRSRSIAVMAGDYIPADRPIRAAAGVRLTDSALGAIARVIEDVLWTVDLQQLTVAPIVSSTLGWTQAIVQVRNARFFDVQVALDMEPDGLHVRASIDRVVVDMDATLDLGLGIIAGPEQASARTDRIEIDSVLRLEAASDGKLSLQIADPTLRFDNFRIVFSSGLIQLIEAVLRRQIEREIGQFVRRALADARPKIAAGIEQAFYPPAPVPVILSPGSPPRGFSYALHGESIRYDADGMTAVFRFHAPLVQPHARAAAAPGSLHTPGTMPSLQGALGVLVSADDDAINRLLFAAWADGFLEYDFSAATLPLPGTTTAPTGGLTAFDLMQFLPELQGQLPPAAPISLRARADLPPVIRVRSGVDPIELQLGELILEIDVDRGAGAELLAEIAVTGRITANAGLGPTGLWLNSARHAEFHFDLRRTPIAPIDARRMQVVLGTAVTPLLPHLLNSVPVLPVPHLGQLSFVNVQIMADGPDGDHLSVSGDLRR